MKDSNSIISHLIKQPSLKKYEQIHCYDRLLALLPKSFTSMIRFIYVKNETLFFVLNHPSAKMEFNYKRNLIKSPLKEFSLHFPNSGLEHIQEIKSFVTNKPLEADMPQSASFSAITYDEQSHGTFDSTCENPKLEALFNAIKKTIKDKTDAH